MLETDRSIGRITELLVYEAREEGLYSVERGRGVERWNLGLLLLHLVSVSRIFVRIEVHRCGEDGED